MPEVAKEMEVPKRILLGPGPSNVHPRVLKAMSMPLIGHLDPEFLKIMDQTMELLRTVFQTKNRLTIPVSGTGSAGMEAAFVNFIEEGDKVIVAINGVFGERVADLLRRLKAQITEVRAEWGKLVDVSKIEAELKKSCFNTEIGKIHIFNIWCGAGSKGRRAFSLGFQWPFGIACHCET